jgi:hypothetical protein
MNHSPSFLTRALRVLTTVACMAVAVSAVGAFAQTADAPAVAVDDIREAIKTQLPAPPEGFVWQLYKNAVFLQAVNWNEAQSLSSTSGVPSTVYSASPERFTAQRPFEMGLTVQIIRGSHKIRRIEAKDMALLYLQPMVDAHTKENVLMLERSENADSERTVFRYRDVLAGSNPVIVHKFVVASNEADTVHVFTFQSPEDTWKENWKAYGKPFLGRVVVLPNVSAN